MISWFPLARVVAGFPIAAKVGYSNDARTTTTSFRFGI
jgi:hypothetical protein